MDSLKAFPRQQILLAFSSHSNKGLLKEVFTQINRRLRIDFADNETDILYYLVRHRTKFPPGLIVFDPPPMQPGITKLIDEIHKQEAYADIPVVVLLSPVDLPDMVPWVRGKNVHLFPRPAMPSECKRYVVQMLAYYHAGNGIPAAI